MNPARFTFAALPCSDLADQAQRLRSLAGEAPFLELCQMRGRSAIRTSALWLFTLSSSGQVAAVAAGFERRALGRRSLVVALARPFPEPDVFWEGLRGFARGQRISFLVVESVGPDHPPVPQLTGETARVEATSYVLDLRQLDGGAVFSKNHRRNVQRAIERGAQLISQPEQDAVRDHRRLVRASLDRRSDRGEDVPGELAGDSVLDHLRTGHAKLFQATLDGQVVSSDLVVQIGADAYYLSGGSSPEGMKAGSAHFLMHEVIQGLKRAGCHSLSLGYPNSPGLARFKEGFGAQPVPVERVEVQWGGPIDRLMQRLGRALRSR